MRLKKPSRTILILAGLGFALRCMLAPRAWAYVSLQQVYDNAGPGGGYDKLLELDPQEEYGGDLNITGGVTVCIHGNGAKIIGLSSPSRSIRVYGSKLDIDHCILAGRGTAEDGIYYDSNSYPSPYGCGYYSYPYVYFIFDVIFFIRFCRKVDFVIAGNRFLRRFYSNLYISFHSNRERVYFFGIEGDVPS